MDECLNRQTIAKSEMTDAFLQQLTTASSASLPDYVALATTMADSSSSSLDGSGEFPVADKNYSCTTALSSSDSTSIVRASSIDSNDDNEADANTDTEGVYIDLSPKVIKCIKMRSITRCVRTRNYTVHTQAYICTHVCMRTHFSLTNDIGIWI